MTRGALSFGPADVEDFALELVLAQARERVRSSSLVLFTPLVLSPLPNASIRPGNLNYIIDLSQSAADARADPTFEPDGHQ